MFCIRFSELFYIIAEKVCTFVPASSSFSYSPSRGNHFYMPFLWLFCFVLDSTYKWYYEVFIFLSLTYFSLSIIASKSVHVVTNGRILFFFQWQSSSPWCTYHIFFIHSLIQGHSGGVHILAIVNNASINIGVQITIQCPVFISIRYIPSNGIIGSSITCIFNFLKNFHTVFHNDCTNLHCCQQCIRIKTLGWPHFIILYINIILYKYTCKYYIF